MLPSPGTASAAVAFSAGGLAICPHKLACSRCSSTNSSVVADSAAAASCRLTSSSVCCSSMA
eukprot:1446024-Pyramimonas_sp.AAC.1